MFFELEMEDAEALDRVMRHVGAQIVEQCLPIGQDRPLGYLRAQQAERGGMDGLQGGDAGLAHALHPRQRFGIGSQEAGDAAEFVEQRLGERLGILPRDRQREQIFDQLVIEQRVRPALEQATAQARAVAAIVWRLGHARFVPANAALFKARISPNWR